MKSPLRPGDPTSLGGYRLLARLGEGGMGSVFLGRRDESLRDDRGDGPLVAIKMIKPEYAHDEEFRGRFRSEVKRAWQVPPFCTAAVLDADPDHRTPYLVVEYVDGPSLNEVVAREGPLADSRLHGVAVGVATALTAIHGAGVIHRDLKPQNVLFALGSPKVIDFGIARALEVTSQHTHPDQMVGTVAYMAPERFDGNHRDITPAADVFAWGAVIAYAGTGRTPFRADSPVATAARILTQPPDLTGLTGPLADLVALALSKDPEDRPAAHELLNLLLAQNTDPRAFSRTSSLDPRLREAAEAAQLSGRHVSGGGKRPGLLGGGKRPALLGGGRRPGLFGGDKRPGAPIAGAPIDGARISGAQISGAAMAEAPIADARNVNAPIADAPGIHAPVAGAQGRRRRVWTVLAATAAATVLMAAVGLVSRTADEETHPTPTVAAAAMPVPGAVRGPWVVDALDRPGQWKATTDAYGGRCSFQGGGLTMTTPSFAMVCPGTAETFAGNQSISAGVTVANAQSCAEIQFRTAGEASYWLDLCPRTVRIRHEGAVQNAKLGETDQAPFVPGQRRDVVLSLRDEAATVTVDGEAVLETRLTDPSLLAGKVAFGVGPADQAKDQDVLAGAVVTQAEIRPFGEAAASALSFTDVRRGSTKSIVKVHGYFPKTRSVVVEPVLFMTGDEYCQAFHLKSSSDTPCEQAWLTEDSRMRVTLPTSATPKLFSTFDDPERCAGDPVTVGTCTITPAKLAERLGEGGLVEVTTSNGTVTAMADVYTP
ncbi:protein kinase [Actinoplanes sp. LDG1-06]|uniref:Protein kinase n=1 Tax=Paractinoplanes ovalisporus TaxID=2810368 RepID=A0ABS2AF71_9ACTN|nr:serine/threonine-protein kinase [Actinoplanes ovalisporus]MBM2618472.1 protein kinase [Actinoplanes ovalisporus]